MPRPNWQKLGGYLTALGFIVVAVVWIASGELSGQPGPEPRKTSAELAQEGQRPAVRVREQTAERYRETLTVRGRTEADRSVQVRAEAEGRIIELTVDKGDRVEKGMLLARVDPQDKPASLKEAKARLAQRQAELDAAQRLSEKGFRAATELAKSRAEYEQAEARVRQAQVALSQTRITAPFTGRIGDRPVEMGDYVTPGGELFQVIDLDPIRFVANVTERNIDRLSLGTRVTAKSIGGAERQATLAYIAADADPQTRTFRVEAKSQNADARFRAGVTIDMTIPLTATRAHFIAPSILSLSDDGTVGVKILDETDTVRFREVSIRADTPKGVWVTGLPETVTLITAGQNFVATGQKVRPVSETSVTAEIPDTPLDDIDAPDADASEVQP